MPSDWHTKMEKSLIDSFGGKHTETYGADGTRNGNPLEVRVAKDDDRFRLNRETHEQLTENNGTYIFDDVSDNKPPKEVDADRVDSLLGSPDDKDDWFSDRGYSHRFIDTDDIF